jgi:BirA family transcriptional regulator, biotin operon repressor / biotin---[acetyl-CoA-carboxylase] ligase
MSAATARWNVNRYDKVASTQDLALAQAQNLISSSTPISGIRTAYVADAQTNGHGQHGRIWQSPPGGLYLSMLLPDAPLAAEGRLPLVLGMAIAKFVEQLGVPAATIRWPNDVLISGKKVAGVLAQAVVLGSRNIAVVGVGINLNTDPNMLGSQLSRTALSVASKTGAKIDPTHALTILLEQVDIFVDHLFGGRWEVVFRELKARDALNGRVVSLVSGGESFTGRAEGISDDGGLLLRTTAGLKPFSSATVQSVDGCNIRQDPVKD